MCLSIGSGAVPRSVDGISIEGRLLFRAEQYDDEEERPGQGPPGVHRAVFPRDFGRQNAKDIDRRVQQVLA
jgi:hypothetical protein